MAKSTPETSDRFRIFAETSSEEMGPLLAQLTRMGLQNIGYELITDVVRFNQNERVKHDTGAEEFALSFLTNNPTFKVLDLVRHFEADDRPGNGAYSVVRRLVEKELVVKLGPGNYQRADVKAIAAPAVKEKETHTRRGKSPRYEVSNETLLLKYIRGKKRVTVQQAGAYLEGEGRNKKSASPLIGKFAKDGLLKQIEPGNYEVLPPKKAAKAVAKLNGQSSSPGAAAHG